MKIFDTRQIKEIDAYTIRHEPIPSIDLMERAAETCTSWLVKRTDRNAQFFVFAGPGNNGGDGWAIARLLIGRGYQDVTVYQLNIGNMISDDSRINRQRLIDQGKARIFEIHSESDLPEIDKNTIVIDALFGSGLSRPIAGLPASIIKHINVAGCRVIAIDIPSGLMGEDNSGNTHDHIIHATETITFQFPKRSFLFAENEKYVGQWHILDIGLHHEAIQSTPSNFQYIVFDDIVNALKPRSAFSHKGTFGHALLIAGSYGMMGAAILASKACLRTGVGLITSHVPRLGYPIIQAVVPESIFSIDKSDHRFTGIDLSEPYTALGVGPGIGTGAETIHAFEKLLKDFRKPVVIDADALNIIAQKKELLNIISPDSILTPHPKEFDRIFGNSQSGYARNILQIEMAQKFKIIIVLKGAHTSVALPDGTCFFNSTGNPGMATAGCGDVLTGMILSLLSQGYDPARAAILGPFIHGLAGDIAVGETGYHACIASDIIHSLGNAFVKLESHVS